MSFKQKISKDSFTQHLANAKASFVAGSFKMSASSHHLTQIEDCVPESKLLEVHLRGRLPGAEVAVAVLGDLQVDLVLVKNSEISSKIKK